MFTVRCQKYGEDRELRVAPAFMREGYRVLVDKYTRGISSWIADDGESDRVYATKELAREAILEYMKKEMDSNSVSVFTVYRD